jgi:hypothetical protein
VESDIKKEIKWCMQKEEQVSFLPRCNECGRIMVSWVRDDTFLEGKDWREGVRRYEDFLKNIS